MLDSYATIAGGWYLEQRCNRLPKEYKAEFDWNIAQTNVALSRIAKQSFLFQIQQSARKVAEAATCNNEVTDLIVTTLVKSRETTKLLTGQTYTPALGLALEAQYIVVLRVGQKLDDKCKILPVEIRKEYDGRIDEITMAFAKSAGEAAANRVKTSATDAFEKSGVSCGKAEGILKSGLAQARQMSPKWRAN